MQMAYLKRFVLREKTRARIKTGTLLLADLKKPARKISSSRIGA
jgi:hypothetical protein